MQRRATALYVAFFLLVGAASYTLIATAQGSSEHTVGLWGVTILCGIVTILLVGMAYMPSRY